jgi:predicted Na+-dependent transporter
MQHLLPITILVLMVSTGMSLRAEEVVAKWRQLTPSVWLRLLLATFIIPPAIALALGEALRLDPPALAALFIVAAVPGAPLMTRSLAKKGHDLQLAAAYQIWAAFLVPVMVPLLVYFAGLIYDRDFWIPPLKLLQIVLVQQLAPLAAGAIFARFLPAMAARLHRPFTVIGNVLFAFVLVALLVKAGPALGSTSPRIFAAALILATACLALMLLLMRPEKRAAPSLALGNVNRHVGLALLLAGQQLQIAKAVPTILAYAIAAPLVMGLWTWRVRRREATADPDTITSGS